MNDNQDGTPRPVIELDVLYAWINVATSGKEALVTAPVSELLGIRKSGRYIPLLAPDLTTAMALRAVIETISKVASMKDGSKSAFNPYLVRFTRDPGVIELPPYTEEAET